MPAPARGVPGEKLAIPVDLARTTAPARVAPPPLPAADSTFLPQFRSTLLPDGVPWGPENGNCGPTSIVNALRLVGLDVPGFHGERTQDVIDAARRLATGSDDPTVATLKTQQAFALRAAGASVDTTRSLDETLAAVRGGAVALVGGDRAAPGWPRRDDDPPPTGVANHASVIARYEPAADAYVVYDPALPAPVRVEAGTLTAFTQAVDGARMPRLGLLVRGSSATGAANDLAR